MTDPTTHEAVPARPFREYVREALYHAGMDLFNARRMDHVFLSRVTVQRLTEAARQWLAFTDAAKPVCDELEGKGP